MKVRALRSILSDKIFELRVAVELGVVIGKGGRDISQANAESHVAGYGESSIPAEPTH
jgi:2-keto-4-pentenoate hydratase/2-oxohepta-3-ene-1,7-dioic acid hydratase in catechol pathway